MFRNRLYYTIKPFLPQALRWSLRRWHAVRVRRQTNGIWPIMPGSEKPPAGWPGWPDGKKFALVLTHDVEGPEGLRQCLRLMKFEQELGFRSCFNLIPEGAYQVSPELRQELTRNGFEVGVHDLKHNGKLYHSRRQFSADAIRINHYLQEWNAIGFRSAFMLRRLDWLHDLNIAYDCSTFDTDPFEPQPEGYHTIFPFWVQRKDHTTTVDKTTVRCPLNHGPSRNCTAVSGPSVECPVMSGHGYVELPYTLPQDSTLFLLLGEKQPFTWYHKLDWIANKGGMALVNVHPDYMQFPGEPAKPHSYPLDYFLRFLKRIQSCFAGLMWNPLPAEVACFLKQTMLAHNQVNLLDKQSQARH